MNAKAQAGFTLIELVAVIVLLGILAATALPLFINLQGDAKASVIESMKGTVKSVSSQAYAKALVSGQTGATGSIEVDGITINLKFGYPDRTGIWDLIDYDPAKFDEEAPAATANTSHIGYNLNSDTGNLVTDDDCHVTYVEAANATTKPVISTVVTSCN